MNYFVVKITKFICVLFPEPFSFAPCGTESIANVDQYPHLSGFLLTLARAAGGQACFLGKCE